MCIDTRFMCGLMESRGGPYSRMSFHCGKMGIKGELSMEFISHIPFMINSTVALLNTRPFEGFINGGQEFSSASLTVMLVDTL